MFSINYATIVDPILHDVRMSVPDFAAMKAGDSVLDVCCGSGAQIYEYTRRGLIGSGLDNSQEMLALAEKYYNDGASGASFKLADAAHLPFTDSSFDFTSISMALHDKDFTIVDRIVSEMKRVLRTGGALIFMDYSVPLPHSVSGHLIRAMEFIAGDEHFSNFRWYMKNGGLQRILEINRLSVIKEMQVKMGNITLVLACAPSLAPR